MRQPWRAGHGVADREERPDERPDVVDCTEHAWRLRDVTYALPGAYVCEICERCGAMNLVGPDELAEMCGQPREYGRATTSRRQSPDDDGSFLGALAQRWSPLDASQDPPGSGSG